MSACFRSAIVHIMPRKVLKSIGHAIDGLTHAIATERNVKIALFGVALTLFLGASVELSRLEWIFLFLSNAAFVSMEIMNTAIERISDVVKHHLKHSGSMEHDAGIGHSKDVAAGASLVIAIAWTAGMVMLFWPYLQ